MDERMNKEELIFDIYVAGALIASDVKESDRNELLKRLIVNGTISTDVRELEFRLVGGVEGLIQGRED